jgi:hypothetical protein
MRSAFDRITRIIGQLFERIDAFFTGGFDLNKAIGDLQKLENRVLALRKELQFKSNEALFLFDKDNRTKQEAKDLIALLKQIEEIRKAIRKAEGDVSTAETNISRTEEGKKFVDERTSGLGPSLSESIADTIAVLSKKTDRAAAAFTGSASDKFKDIVEEIQKLASATPIPPRGDGDFTRSIIPVEIDRERIVRQLKEREAILEAARTRELQQQQAATQISGAIAEKDFAGRLITGREFFRRQQLLRREDLANQQRVLRERLESVQTQARREIALIQLQAEQRAREALPAAERARTGRIDVLQKQKTLTQEENAELQKLLATTITIESLTKLTNAEEKEATNRQNTARSKSVNILKEILGLKTRGRVEDERDLAIIKQQNRENQRTLQDRDAQLASFGGQTNSEQIKRITQQGNRLQADFAAKNTTTAQQTRFNTQQAQININQAIKTQIDAVTNAIDAAFATIIDGFVEGSFEFRDLAQTLSKDFITAGFEGIINQVKDTVTNGLKKVFTALGDGSKNAAAGAQRAAQGLTLAFGLLLAVLSRTGSKGEFSASGAGAGGGVDQSSVQTRGLIGGDTSVAIAEVNSGLQEAMIPTNAILSQIEVNTRGLQGLNVGLDPNELAQAITAQVQGLFSQALLQTP